MKSYIIHNKTIVAVDLPALGSGYWPLHFTQKLRRKEDVPPPPDDGPKSKSEWRTSLIETYSELPNWLKTSSLQRPKLNAPLPKASFYFLPTPKDFLGSSNGKKGHTLGGGRYPRGGFDGSYESMNGSTSLSSAVSTPTPPSASSCGGGVKTHQVWTLTQFFSC